MNKEQKKGSTDQSTPLNYSISANGHRRDKDSFIVPFDGFKIERAICDFTVLKSNVHFPLLVDEATGEKLNKPVFNYYKGLQLILKTDSFGNELLYVSGSLHKFANNGTNNANTFTYSELERVLFEFKTVLGIDLNSQLNNIEFGYNLQTQFEPRRFINGLLAYQRTAFKPFTIENAIGAECTKSYFYVKVYDKGHQYKLQENILRVEIKARKMKKLIDEGIRLISLSDLLNPIICTQLNKVLFQTIAHSLFFDPSVKYNHLKPKQRETILKGLIKSNWERDTSQPNTSRLKKQYERAKANFQYLVEQLQADKVKNEVLIDLEKIGAISPTFKIDYRLFETSSTAKNLQIEYTIQKDKKGAISHFKYSVNEYRVCLVCNGDLKDKKQNAKFCSKKCKNDFTNPRLNQYHQIKRKIERRTKEPTLFLIDEMFSAEIIASITTPNSIYHNSKTLKV